VKKLALLGCLFLSFAAYAAADVINFNVAEGGHTLVATAGGVTMGPAVLLSVTDNTTDTTVLLPGIFTVSTGIANSFTCASGFCSAFYSTGGAKSVLIVGSPPFCSGCVLISGVVENNSVFFTSYPNGPGSFIAPTFDVTQVNPKVLALFGLGPGFAPEGSVGASFINDNFDSTTSTVTGDFGGATVTITSTVVPEPVGLGLAGMGLLTIAGVLKRSYL